VPRTPQIALATTFAALVVSLGACGGDGEATTTASTTSTTTTPTEPVECEPTLDGGAFIDASTGEFTGLQPDCRQGTLPEPVATADLEEAADVAGCDLELGLPDEGNDHIPASKPTSYETNPPTSGDHDEVPLADGAYEDTPEERFFVHSMEHGRIVVQYQPDLAEEDQLALKGVLEEDPDGMILVQNDEMPYEVAATAWTNLLGCDTYTPEALDAIRDFRDEFRGQGPEDIPL
jgi:hypothetical protein